MLSKEKWVDIKEIAEYLKFKEVTIRGWIQEGFIPCKKIGNEWRFKLSEIDEWVQSGKSDYAATKASKRGEKI